MNLSANSFRRYDESPDAFFYQTPRLVTHIDDNAIAAVTQIYRETLPKNGRVLDLMSSWISHLPTEIEYAEVVGVGMNAIELAENPRLTSWRVQDLNQTPNLTDETGYFDAAICCVSIDYLTNPVAVLKSVARTLKTDAPLVVTFSNRCFPTKVVAIWHTLSEPERVAFVVSLFEQTDAYHTIETIDRSRHIDEQRIGDPLYAVIARGNANSMS